MYHQKLVRLPLRAAACSFASLRALHQPEAHRLKANPGIRIVVQVCILYTYVCMVRTYIHGFVHHGISRRENPHAFEHRHHPFFAHKLTFNIMPRDEMIYNLISPQYKSAHPFDNRNNKAVPTSVTVPKYWRLSIVLMPLTSSFAQHRIWLPNLTHERFQIAPQYYPHLLGWVP
jgi:hypothetical protein